LDKLAWWLSSDFHN